MGRHRHAGPDLHPPRDDGVLLHSRADDVEMFANVMSEPLGTIDTAFDTIADTTLNATSRLERKTRLLVGDPPT